MGAKCAKPGELYHHLYGLRIVGVDHLLASDSDIYYFQLGRACFVLFSVDFTLNNLSWLHF